MCIPRVCSVVDDLDNDEGLNEDDDIDYVNDTYYIEGRTADERQALGVMLG